MRSSEGLKSGRDRECWRDRRKQKKGERDIKSDFKGDQNLDSNLLTKMLKCPIEVVLLRNMVGAEQVMNNWKLKPRKK
jgi:hypothetical protein